MMRRKRSLLPISGQSGLPGGRFGLAGGTAERGSMNPALKSQAAYMASTPGCLSTPPPSASIRVRWENHHQRRFYEAFVQRDLFGGWELWKVWGGLGSARGGQQVLPAGDEQSGLAALAQLCRHRERRGYMQVAGGSAISNSAAAR
ncbi:MAG: WGR domain-containing protein [Aquincola sp.]|nr:WGR domain-containing protein [Aquincola sp.]